jgi:hypothetical protein
MDRPRNYSCYFSDKRIEELVGQILGPNQLEHDAPALALLTIIHRLAYDGDFTVCDNNALRLSQAIYRRTQAFEAAAFEFADRAADSLSTVEQHSGSVLRLDRAFRN